jgi:hypothetical protein
MIGNVLLAGQELADSGILTLQINRQLVIHISALEAQKKVTRFVHWEISSQMHAESPVLVVNDDIFWQVPVHLTLPAFGDVGCVGVLKVDPITGEIDSSPASLHLIKEKADQLALRFSPSAAQPG